MTSMVTGVSKDERDTGPKLLWLVFVERRDGRPRELEE